VKYDLLYSNENGAKILKLFEYISDNETQKITKQQTQLEHIYPQTPNRSHAEIYEEEIYKRLGNMLILEKDNNISAKNFILKDKIIDYKKSSFKTTENFIKQYGKLDEMTELEIEKRSKQVINELLAYYPYPGF